MQVQAVQVALPIDDCLTLQAEVATQTEPQLLVPSVSTKVQLCWAINSMREPIPNVQLHLIQRSLETKLPQGSAANRAKPQRDAQRAGVQDRAKS